MSQVSEDGFWKFVDGKWVPTEKQDEALKSGMNPHLMPQVPQINTAFSQSAVIATNDHIVTNESASKSSGSVSSLTTTTDHVDSVKFYHGNPFYQDPLSRARFDRIREPGSQELKRMLLRTCEGVETNARQQFSSGDMSHDATDIVKKLYNDEEELLSDFPLKIFRSNLLGPAENSVNGFKIIEETEHYGVRGIITNQRVMLIDSTENAVTTLETPETRYPAEFFQRKHAGIFEITHKIMHDFWVKSIPLEDITGTEFHFTHHSKSSRIVRRFHHLISLFFALIGLTLVGISFAYIEFVEDFVIIFSLGISVLIIAFFAYHYLSRIKLYTTISTHRKERNLKIGYFDRVYNRNLVLNLLLEDGQDLIGTTDWLQILEKMNIGISEPGIDSE